MSDTTDLLERTVLGTRSGFARYPACPGFCEGHADPSTEHEHTTPWEYFGDFGVTVAQNGTEPARVTLVDLPHPEASYSPTYARVLAYQILLAADLAERHAHPSPTAGITRALAEALGAVAS